MSATKEEGDLRRQQRRQAAFDVFLREGAIGGAIGGAGALAAHFVAEKTSPFYRNNLNWRAKLFAISAAAVAGFSIRGELRALDMRDAELAANEAAQAAKDEAYRTGRK